MRFYRASHFCSCYVLARNIRFRKRLCKMLFNRPAVPATGANPHEVSQVQADDQADEQADVEALCEYVGVEACQSQQKCRHDVR